MGKGRRRKEMGRKRKGGNTWIFNGQLGELYRLEGRGRSGTETGKGKGMKRYAIIVLKTNDTVKSVSMPSDALKSGIKQCLTLMH